jgi:curved DNA-binding protein CbpA
MQDADLYAVLDVPREATTAEIRRAYRRKAKKTHPDNGGTAHEFDALNKAHRVLSDDTTRARYDQTGEAEAPQPDDLQTAALEMISQSLSRYLLAEEDIAERDLVTEMATCFSLERRNVQKELRTLQSAKAKAEKAAELFEKKSEGDNVMLRIANWHIKTIVQNIASGERVLSRYDRTLEILSDYKYNCRSQRYATLPPPLGAGGLW